MPLIEQPSCAIQPGSQRDKQIVGRYAFWVDDERKLTSTRRAAPTASDQFPGHRDAQRGEPIIFGGMAALRRVVRMAHQWFQRNSCASYRNIFADNIFSLTAYSRSPAELFPNQSGGGWRCGMGRKHGAQPNTPSTQLPPDLMVETLGLQPI